MSLSLAAHTAGPSALYSAPFRSPTRIFLSPFAVCCSVTEGLLLGQLDLGHACAVPFCPERTRGSPKGSNVTRERQRQNQNIT